VNAIDPGSHSFIVKVWLEEAATETAPATWRGHITHVPDGKRRFLQDLSEIAPFIVPYLVAMGVEPGPVSDVR
jgi:hypothetical protein